MAKKNLHSLMSGIIGTGNNAGSTPEPFKLTISTAQQPNNPTASKPRPGRPKRSTIENETRATFAVSVDLLRKVKYISLMEDKLQQDVVNEAISLYVANWEEENGKIKMPKRQ